MSLFHAPLFLDVDEAAHEAGTRAGGYGLRYGRLARARRDTDLPRFGITTDIDVRPAAERYATCDPCTAPA